jgi:hypothetical protein
VFFSFYVYIISSLLTWSKNDNNSRIIMMNPTPVTPSDSSCVFGGYTGCLDGEFMLSAFTGTNMSSSVSSSDSDDSLKGDNMIDPPSSTQFLQYI